VALLLVDPLQAVCLLDHQTSLAPSALLLVLLVVFLVVAEVERVTSKRENPKPEILRGASSPRIEKTYFQSQSSRMLYRLDSE